MPRNLVLPFPPPCGLTVADRNQLRELAASNPEMVLEFFVTGRRRGVATLTAAGRQFWLERSGARIRIRDARDGRLLAEGEAICAVFRQAHMALLPGGTAVWGGRTGSFG